MIEQCAILEAAFAAAKDCILITDDGGGIIELNRAAEVRLGFARSEILGRQIAELIVPVDSEEGASLDPLSVTEPLPAQARCQDGSTIPVEVASTEAVLRDGERIFTIVLRDTSEQLATAAALRETKARLTAFLDHAPAAMYLKDLDGRYSVVNKFLAARFGVSPKELIGQRPTDLLDAAAAAEASEVDQRIRETGEIDIRNSQFETAIGTRSAMSIRFPVRDEQGTIQYIGGVILDTTEQTEAQRKLRESEARLAAFMQYAPLTMFLKDADGRYLMINQQAATNLGRSVEEVLGHTAREIAPAPVADAAAAIEAEVLASGLPRTDEQVFDLATGRVWGINTRFPVPDANGNFTQIGGVFVDITAQKLAEEELARSREALAQTEKLTALGSLLAGVSHELNNPLAIVVGEAILLEEDAEGSELAASARRIRKSAERCSRIVQTFLAMARQKKPERVKLDVENVISAAIELTDYGMRSNGIEIITDFAPGMPQIAADSDQLHQVIVNLLINAQQALQQCAPPRRIRITTRLAEETNRVCIAVADNGPGIPDEVARRIFEPFFTTKPQGSGTGIGLSFSQGVVEAHGGSLSLDSSGEGATFRIELPVDETAAGTDARQEATVAGSPLQKGDALVVDDEPELAGALARLLEREGYRCKVLTSGQEAIEAAAAQEFDIVVSDLRMPGVDGPALLQWLSANRPHMAAGFGFITGDTLGPAAMGFLAECGRPYIEKPFTRERIRELLMELRSGSQAPTAL